MENWILTEIFQNGGLSVEVAHAPTFIEIEKRPRDNAHIHAYCEVYFNLAGDVSFAVENKVYSVSSGDLIITAENEVHYCIYQSDCFHDCYCLWITADENFKSFLEPFFNRQKGQYNKISLNPSEKQNMIGWLDRILKEKSAGRIGSVGCVSSVFNVLNLLTEKQSYTVPPKEFPPVFREILSYIDQNYLGNCTVTAICQEFFTSYSTVNRLFHSHLGTTPSAYIENKRFSLAKSMLMNGRSVQETFEECGFPDYSHFIARFKKKFGITPSQFKKKN